MSLPSLASANTTRTLFRRMTSISDSPSTGLGSRLRFTQGSLFDRRIRSRLAVSYPHGGGTHCQSRTSGISFQPGGGMSRGFADLASLTRSNHHDVGAYLSSSPNTVQVTQSSLALEYCIRFKSCDLRNF